MKEYIDLQKLLRDSGISTEIYPGEGKLKKQMEYANKINSPAVILYGEDEIKSGKPTLRNLSSGDERSIEIKELVNEIKKLSEKIIKIFKKIVLFCQNQMFYLDSEYIIERSGEKFRRSMLTFKEKDGKTMCLRPDLTVASCINYLKEKKIFFKNLLFRSSL